MVNEQVKKYTIKEFRELLDISDNVARKKIKKHRLISTQEVINNRLTTVIEINEDMLEALIHEVNFNKEKIKPINEYSTTDQPPINEQPKTNIILREQADFSIKLLIEKLSESHLKEVEAKDEIIKILKDDLEEYKLTNKQIQTQLNNQEISNRTLLKENERLENANSELVQKMHKLELENQQLKDLNKRWWNFKR